MDWILVGGSAFSEGQTADMQAHFDAVRSQFDFRIGAVDVTGHSLGGYLTTVLVGDLNRQDYILHGFTFNGIGYFDGPSTFAPAVMSRLLEEIGVVSPAIASPKLSNFFGTAGVEIAAGLLTLVGSNDGVFIEDSLNPFRLHSIDNLLSGLTCYNYGPVHFSKKLGAGLFFING